MFVLMQIQKPIQPSLSGATVMTLPRLGMTQAARQVTLPSNVQQIHVPGNKFHYIRLANPSSSTAGRNFKRWGFHWTHAMSLTQ